jgi:hypothetical protein
VSEEPIFRLAFLGGRQVYYWMRSPVTAGENIRPGGGLAVAVQRGFLVAKEVIQ